MPYTQVEFFGVPDECQLSDDGAPLTAQAPPTWLAFVAPAAWAAAAILAAGAPFATIADVHDSGALAGSRRRDGWGRLQGFGPDGQQFGAHGARIGAVFLVCAVALGVLALTNAAHVARPAWPRLSRRTSTRLAIGGSGLLIALTLAVGFYLVVMASEVRAENRVDSDVVNTGGIEPQVVEHLHVGFTEWLSSGAVVCAIVALLTTRLSRRARQAHSRHAADGRVAEYAGMLGPDPGDDPAEDVID